jgi:hypothetical protein
MFPTVRTVLTALATVLAAQQLAAQIPAARFDGRPAFAEGIDLGYYLWRDEGDTWHVRWTTMGQQRRFTGSVNAEGGELKNLKRIDVETERRVLYPGRPARVVRGPAGRVRGVRPGRAPAVATREQDHFEKDGDARIVFAALTDDDIDGFDFKVDKDVTLLRFVLNVEGRERPGSVEIGANNARINNLPLIVRLR